MRRIAIVLRSECALSVRERKRCHHEREMCLVWTRKAPIWPTMVMIIIDCHNSVRSGTQAIYGSVLCARKGDFDNGILLFSEYMRTMESYQETCAKSCFRTFTLLKIETRFLTTQDGVDQCCHAENHTEGMVCAESGHASD